ncbi:MAG TPA: NUDIX domain-containing protein [Patescibacteria group bacterium]|nr:NUDIX domain-containing protein [Patescibacteria group bacterium]
MNSKDQPFFVGQKAFIKNSENKLLVLLDPASGLDLPGGKVQSDEEDLKLSLKREVFEETGLEIEVGEVFHVWRFHYPIEKVEASIRDSRTDGNIYRVGFACILKSGDVKLSNEHTEYKWIDKSEVDSLRPWKGDIDAIEKYFNSSF